MTDLATALTDPQPPLVRVDRRNLRAARTRNGILAACCTAMVCGDFRPSVIGVAKSAGVSIRSVFQHFGSLEGLHREALKADFVAPSIIAAVFGSDVTPICEATKARIVEVVVFGRVLS